MSKKKSYMNYKNVLLENKFIDAFKHLLGFNKAKLPKLSGEEKKLMKIPAIKKLVTSFYSDYEKLKNDTNRRIQKLKDKGVDIDFME
jgi:hypothetical protein|tara:strand:+ start:319 stop:579 length:261 start_codon:yes stop_codon:yes gene_type:complete